ncbi:proton pump complex quinol oxidase subunit SoxB [Sulfolobus acidocaldarius]|uniref:Quinol oxidase subunit 1 n=4 Tax=Sulfolobus acidocaldarius TaxID=2285 RepID=QOX1_SULAC|nr:proton pump complex quinol oxidase subunit SoxB [Sulfolobus acidocaldarius]P98004.2 RecName: Full=Quinol oxidase subunit 1; AltName: Full=Cytochrome aa3 subunit 1; AltName: Full=Oxidase aa(3) subunit 1; AltName: Full=Quinol oxidase polypeptide I [Sulfolobus acidocaldarius DSM 639]AGE71980.1 cytochrome c and quinol oxidase polypeptide I [Sulfolobus acidocaldarius N8]AGE74296.1 cytochrome c and quinol oxidase polypeptide I [Sulfolobus acidocaldarius Ron12/I]ALU29823.1 cytochrome B6 [Sulfolobus
MSLIERIKNVVWPKDTLSVVWLYTIGSIFWLGVLGIAAMNLRTFLTYDQNSPNVGELYYSALTIHGWAAMIAFVPMAAAAVIGFSLYKSKLSIIHTKQMAIFFWLSNVLLGIAMAGSPDMGWYMYPPLAIESNSQFHAFLFYTTPQLMGMAYLVMSIAVILQTAAFVTLIADAYATKPKGERLNIFAAYGVAFSIVIAVTLPALAAATLWYTLYFFANVPVNNLLWAILFWFYGHPVVYYVPFPLFGALYYYIPQYAGRSLYSEKWARWNIYLLAIGTMGVWVHHLQTWPLPIVLREWVNLSTLILATGSGLTVLNLGLTIFTSRKYDWKDPVGMGALISLIGFILAGAQALVLPENSINPLFHNSYYVVGHFHLMIWTLIIMGYTTVFLDMLRTSFAGFNFSATSSKWMRIGMIWWTAPFMGVGYAMSVAGYLGFLRRMIAYPVIFQPYNLVESFLAEIGIPGLLLTLFVGMFDALAYASKQPVFSSPSVSSFSMQVDKGELVKKIDSEKGVNNVG